MAEARRDPTVTAIARLTRWGRTAPNGMARVAYTSAFDRDAMVDAVTERLSAAEVPVQRLTITRQETTQATAHDVLEALRHIPEGVVFIDGFEVYAGEPTLEDTLLNHFSFLRERLTQPRIRQVWLLTERLSQRVGYYLPDLDSWFLLRLTLPTTQASVPEPAAPTVTLDNARVREARQRSRDLQERFERTIADEPDAWTEAANDLLLPALRALTDAGDIARAIALEAHYRIASDEPLSDRIQQQKETNVDALESWAMFYWETSQWSHSLALTQVVLHERERALGADHPDTLTSVNNSAELLRVTGRYGEAEPLHRRALEDTERILGADHPSTLVSVNNLALLLRATSQYGEAESLHRRALEGQERVLGADHPGTLLSVNNLAALLESMGRYDEAEPLCRRALESRERVLGADHPDTLISLFNLGMFYVKQSQCASGLPLMERAANTAQRTLGPEHPYTKKFVQNLAVARKDCR